MANEWERRQQEVEKTDKKKVSFKSLREMLGIYHFLLPYKGKFALGLLFLFSSVMTGLTFPKLFGDLADIANGKSDTMMQVVRPIQEIFGVSKPLNALAIFLGIMVLVQAMFSFGRIYFFAQVSERTMADIRQAVYQKIVSMPIPFFENRRVGELISRLSSDITQLQDVLSVTLAELLRQLLTLSVVLAYLLYSSPKLTLFMLATFPVLVVATLIFGRFIRKTSKKAQDELASANVVVEESLHAIQIVKAFTNERWEIARYGSALQKGVTASLRAATYRSIFVSFVMLAIFGGIVLVLWFGAREVDAGNMTVGMLIKFIIYTVFVGVSVGGLGDIYSQMQKTIGASERVREILQEEPELLLTETAAQQAALKLKGNIEFRQVQFSYPTRNELAVLRGVDLFVNEGEKIALVGHSGAGKSTIAQLLMRFYTHDSGDILIDGQDIGSYHLHDLRHNVGVVPQEVILFGGTIKENVAYGKPNATEAEIWEAIRQANAAEFVEKLPEGLETIVGERGIKLSGGQRQRIAIARAILKNPTILILDEATSALDAESESLVQAALNGLMKNRTTLIIAHRLSTIKNADRIYVLDQGKVADFGTHEELMQKNNGIYANLVRLQAEGVLV